MVCSVKTGKSQNTAVQVTEQLGKNGEFRAFVSGISTLRTLIAVNFEGSQRPFEIRNVFTSCGVIKYNTMLVYSDQTSEETFKRRPLTVPCLFPFCFLPKYLIFS